MSHNEIQGSILIHVVHGPRRQKIEWSVLTH